MCVQQCGRKPCVQMCTTPSTMENKKKKKFNHKVMDLRRMNCSASVVRGQGYQQIFYGNRLTASQQTS